MHLCARRGRADREAIPRGSGLASLCLSPSPFSPAPAPAPTLPAPTRRASVTGSLATPEGTLDLPENATIFSAPGASPSLSKPLQASPSCPTPILSMKNQSQGGRGAEPKSKRVPTPGVTLHRGGGTAAAAPAPRAQYPAQCPAWPGAARDARPGRERETSPGEDGLTAGEGEGVGGERREGIHRVTFQKNSQRVASRSDSKGRGKKVQLPRRTNERTRKVFFKWARLFLCLFKTLRSGRKRGCVRWSLPPPPRTRDVIGGRYKISAERNRESSVCACV